MRRLRLASIATIAVVALLSACSSSKSTHPTATTTSTVAPTSTVSPTSQATTAPASSTTTAPTASTAPPTSNPSGPSIVSFTGPPSPVQCYALNTSVELHWETRNATRVTLSLNGGGVFATYPNGKRNELEPLTCNGTAQTFRLTAHGAGGASVTRSLTLAERAST